MDNKSKTKETASEDAVLTADATSPIPNKTNKNKRNRKPKQKKIVELGDDVTIVTDPETIKKLDILFPPKTGIKPSAWKRFVGWLRENKHNIEYTIAAVLLVACAVLYVVKYIA